MGPECPFRPIFPLPRAGPPSISLTYRASSSWRGDPTGQFLYVGARGLHWWVALGWRLRGVCVVSLHVGPRPSSSSTWGRCGRALEVPGL
jgi:hypothetical protein